MCVVVVGGGGGGGGATGGSGNVDIVDDGVVAVVQMDAAPPPLRRVNPAHGIVSAHVGAYADIAVDLYVTLHAFVRTRRRSMAI